MPVDVHVHRKKLKETKIMEDKVKNIEKKYLIISGNFKGRMMNLVGEEAEGSCRERGRWRGYILLVDLLYKDDIYLLSFNHR